MSTAILFPVGRLVWGSLHEPQTKDANGQPLTIKTPGHPDFGKPTQRFAFGVAVPKEPGHTHWSQTAWGQQIWALGHAAWPQGQAQLPTFAWKVSDGDSAVPNKKGRINAKSEGFPGHWIVSFSSSFAPKCHDAKGTRELPPDEIRAIKTGYYVQVYGTVDSNKNSQNPGLYMNHSMVAFSGFGPEIHRGPDPTAVGFGSGPAPAGMSVTPPAAMQPPPAAAPPGIPPPVSVPAPAAAAPVYVPPAAPVAAATAVTPHPGFLAPPAAPAPAVAAPPPPAAPAPAVAAPPPPAAPAPAAPAWKGPAGTTQAQYAAAGWSEAQMRQAGLIG